MDSKKLAFQIKNLTHKKNLLNIQLTQLIADKNDLLTNQTNTQPATSNTPDTSNTTIQIPDSQQILDKLTANKQQLIQDLKLIKTQITHLSRVKETLQNKKKELPTIKKTQLDNEIQIKNDELERIMQKHIDVNNQYIEQIYTEYDNKIDLQNKIINLQNDMQQQTNKLKSIQETVHAFRHDTLNSLKLKKHDKCHYNNTVKTLKDREIYIQNTIDTLSTQLQNLQQFKTDIIDNNYNNYNTDANNDANKNANTIFSIPDICTQLNIIDISNMELNSQVAYIDCQIENIKIQIKKFTIKLNNLIDENKLHLCSMQSTTVDKTVDTNATTDINLEQTQLNTQNFKDILKLEKKLANELTTTFEYFSNIYINYNSTIINQHIINFKNDKNTLLEDKQRAIDRFNIMNQRINDEYTTNMNQLQIQIDSTIVEQLIQLQGQMAENMANTVILDNQIKSQCGQIVKINEINDKIQKLQLQITQIDIDINAYTLSNTNE
jgi:hypothetical protein